MSFEDLMDAFNSGDEVSCYKTMKVRDFIEFNPKESLKKGELATKVTMDKLLPFEKFISSMEQAPFSGGSKFKNGDTLLARITPCLENGKTAFVDGLKDEEVAFGPTEFIVLRCREGVSDPQYIYYLATSSFFRNVAIKSMVGSSGRQRVQIGALEDIDIKVPSLEEQRKIASRLALLDSKIALNSRINDNLEAQALALFNELYSKSNQEVLYIDQIQILGGGTPKTGESSFWNGEIPFFTPKDAKFSYTICTEKKLTTEGLSHCNSQLYPKNTVFVTARGTVGKVSMAGVPMAMNQSCYALIGKCIPQLLVYFYTQKIIRNLKNKANGAVFDAITTRDFEYETVMKFSDDLLNKFNAKVEPIYNLILNNHLENQQLTSLRNSLLNQLMSNGAERLV